jgi:ribulose 1,5-bisphosphate synthetase/thiazole synthase
MGASGVKRLESIGLINQKKGMHCLDMNAAEDDIVHYTREVVPGMVVTVSILNERKKKNFTKLLLGYGTC